MNQSWDNVGPLLQTVAKLWTIIGKVSLRKCGIVPSRTQRPITHRTLEDDTVLFKPLKYETLNQRWLSVWCFWPCTWSCNTYLSEDMGNKLNKKSMSGILFEKMTLFTEHRKVNNTEKMINCWSISGPTLKQHRANVSFWVRNRLSRPNRAVNNWITRQKKERSPVRNDPLHRQREILKQCWLNVGHARL